MRGNAKTVPAFVLVEVKMTCVDVLIDLPSKNFDCSYVYSVPAGLENEVEFGKRVLVELGRRVVEGYIVGKAADPGFENLKPVIKVLDEEPVLSPELFQLAQWMADYYMCSVAGAINTIIPPALNKKLPQFVVPLVYEESRIPHCHKYHEFFRRLWEDGEMGIEEARRFVGEKELRALDRKGFIYVGGRYSGYRSRKEGDVYFIKDLSQDMHVLQKKAPRQAEALRIIAEYGEVDRKHLDSLIPAESIKSLLTKGYIGVGKKRRHVVEEKHVLTGEQKRALQVIEEALLSGNRRDFLLYGVTSSGKTEIYIRAAIKAIEQGKRVMVLVPEIALTRHLVDVFASRIRNLAVLHSDMPAGERYDTWKRIRRGEFDLVLGTRSAVFAPLTGLGLVVIDEEQESSYKQESTPRYHAREVARKRADFHSAVLLLGSATPAVETFYQAMNGSLTILNLKERIGNTKIPSVQIQDMKAEFKKGNKVLSGVLQEKIAGCLERGEQVILFINRRGYSPVIICRECGMIVSCPYCSVGMTYHRDIGQIVCHYCNYRHRVPLICDSCGSSYLQQVGVGTQRVEEEVRNLFPGAKIARLDLDSSRRKGIQKNILEKMKNKEIDVLIGTQMVAKGLDFPDVSLVGVVNADVMLNIPDFRAGERCFQLIVQAAGRAGRGSLPGEVVIQTYNPDNAVIQTAAKQDYLGFYYEEIRLRKILNYPPFTNILKVVAASKDETCASEAAIDAASLAVEITDAKEEDITVLGPAPCPIYKMRNRFRYQLIIKCDNMLLLKSIGEYIINRGNQHKDIKLEVEINPLTTI